MVRNFVFSLLFVTALISGAVAYAEPASDALCFHKNKKGLVINGTKTLISNNLVGLVKDSRTGKGIAGVPVTDGYTFTVTDRNGVYQFVADEKCRNVYYTLPAEYKTALDPVTKLPLFYSTTPIDRSRQNRNDFVLEPLDAPEKDFTLVMIGDPQCKTDSDVHRFETETLPDLNRFMSESQAKGKYLNAYAVTLGDLTFDNTVQWGPMHKALSGFALESGDYLPIYNCVGNHDHDAACVDDYTATQTYVDLFGPTDYSFNRGDVHFVVMDDVAVTTTNGKTWKYADNISDRQLEWLKSDLALVKDKEEKMIVFCAHIQFRHNADKDNPDKIKNMAAAMDCLTDFHEAHVMIGHTHYAQNFIHHDYVTKGGTPVYEHIHGAACGAWWSCNLNLAGSPNGYSVYEVSGKTMKNWLAKGTGESPDLQMRVYDGNQIYGGAEGHPSGEYEYSWTEGGIGPKGAQAPGFSGLKGCFVASIWNSDEDNWKVELFQDGKKVGDFKQVPSEIGDVCAISFFYNDLGRKTATWSRSTPQYYWYIEAPGGDPTKVQNWEVRATQTIPGGGVVNEYKCSTLQTDYSGFRNVE